MFLDHKTKTIDTSVRFKGKGNKERANCSLLVDKGGKSSKVEKRPRLIKRILNVNIINFKKVYKPKGGGLDKVDALVGLVDACL